MKKALTCMTVFLLSGCAVVPFSEPARTSLEQKDPRALVEQFQASLPGSFQLLNSVVFEYNWRTFSGIGSVQIRRPDRTFRAAGMSPLGVKLFELSGDQNSITKHYAIAAFDEYGDVATAVGNDIRRIYFDLVPSADARIWRGKYTVRFRQSSGPGMLEHVFGGEGGDLLEKNYYADDGIVWRASYYEYRDQGGKRWPQGIVFINYQYGYRLTIRQKELSIENH
jgi:hypothetical protein